MIDYIIYMTIACGGKTSLNKPKKKIEHYCPAR